MTRYLMLTAAALLSSAATTTVDANTYCFSFSTSEILCDGGMVQTGVDGGAFNGAVRAWVHTNNNCYSGTSQGQGMLGTTRGLGKVSNMSDNYLAKNYGNFSEQISYTLPKKFQNGAMWTAWIGRNGTTSFEVGSGVIINVGNCPNRPVNNSRKSTLDRLRQIIAAHRNTKTISE